VRIVPVLDIQRGIVVRGIAGQRDTYRPVESQLCGEATPRAIGAALVQQLGLNVAYVADLDAIALGDPNLAALEDLRQCGLYLWLDAGIRDDEQARRWAAAAPGGIPLEGVIAGLETLPDVETLGQLLEAATPRRTIFSLDLKQGQPLTRPGCWINPDGTRMTAWQILTSALKVGVRRVLLLDLARVGLGQGVGTESLCRRLHAHDPTVEIITGGGVRSVSDLQAMADAGSSAVLVASALHDGRITSKEIRDVQRDSPGP
jgi:phosphoribosylformimino-5-aminoimidazole carboxamide ribotide isomerase